MTPDQRCSVDAWTAVLALAIRAQDPDAAYVITREAFARWRALGLLHGLTVGERRAA